MPSVERDASSARAGRQDGAKEIEAHLLDDMHPKRAPRSPDAAIARLASRQHGVVSRAQLAALGLGDGALAHRVRSGRLHRLHRGVFAVGHRAVSRHGAWMAAVLAVGDGAVLSHRSAGALWGIRDTARSRIEVTVAGHRRPRARLQIHDAALPADEVTVHAGIPVTTAARTLLDLAAVLAPHQLERAINEAEFQRLTSPVSLEALIARHPHRRGTAALEKILEAASIGRHRTRTDLEAAFLALLDAHGLPRPETNRRTGAGEVDAVWPGQRLIVELDGYQAHGTRQAFENDRARDRELISQGWRVVRITWRQLETDGATIARQLRALLGAAPRA